MSQERIDWPIDKFLEHPRQYEMFSNHPADRFQAFVADIRENGMRDAVEIKPDGTIIDGHHRVRAAKELGWDKVDVIVLHHLDDAGEVAELLHMYSRNCHRRQMTELDLARAFRILKLAMGKSTTGNMRDEIAKILGCQKKGRTLERLEKVLDLPPAIQAAFNCGSIPKTVVYQICSLPVALQFQIGDRLDRGENPKDVVAKWAATTKRAKTTPGDTPCDLYTEWMQYLAVYLDTLNENVESIAGSAMDHIRAAELLARTSAFCDRMRQMELTAREVAVSRIRNVAIAHLS